MGKTIKIYTGGGDRGKTSLFSGERVSKSVFRVEAYGDVDELASALGALVSVLPKACSNVSEEVRQIQSHLLRIGAWLSTTPGSHARAYLREIGEEQVKQLEAAIDRMDGGMPELKGFILPGGHVSASWAHLARTICRRAERHVVRLVSESKEERAAGRLTGAIVFLNRLSDYLFVLARFCNRQTGSPEILWKG